VGQLTTPGGSWWGPDGRLDWAPFSELQVAHRMIPADTQLAQCCGSCQSPKAVRPEQGRKPARKGTTRAPSTPHGTGPADKGLAAWQPMPGGIPIPSPPRSPASAGQRPAQRQDDGPARHPIMRLPLGCKASQAVGASTGLAPATLYCTRARTCTRPAPCWRHARNEWDGDCPAGLLEVGQPTAH